MLLVELAATCKDADLVRVFELFGKVSSLFFCCEESVELRFFVVFVDDYMLCSVFVDTMAGKELKHDEIGFWIALKCFCDVLVRLLELFVSRIG